MRSSTTAAIAALSAAIPSSAMVSHCPGSSSDGCFRWAVPPSTSSSGNPVYFRLEAPSTYQWVGLGIGSGMVNSPMFIIYPDGSGNVTLSTRIASAEVEPEHENRSGVELMAGSGIENGNMIAVVRCTGDCSSDLDTSGTNSWIAAWRASDGGLDTTDTSARLSEHNEHFDFSIDLSKASVASAADPFRESSGSGSNGSNGGNSGSSDGDASETGVSGDSAEPSSAVITAHGIIMAVTFAALYPIGAILMPMLGRWLAHGLVQLFAFFAMWAGFGLGYYYANAEGEFFTSTHTRVGTIVVALLGVQPILGWIHHSQYKSKQRRGIFSHIHIWYGRALMVLGIVNGGFGLREAEGKTSYKIAYAVVAGVFGGLYIGAAIWGIIKRRRALSVTSKGSGNSG